jgi:predicted ATPase
MKTSDEVVEFALHAIEFKFGSSPVAPNLKLRPSPLTLFVGPNNGGKSQAMREIYSSLFGDKNLHLSPKYCIRSNRRIIIADSRITLAYNIELGRVHTIKTISW